MKKKSANNLEKHTNSRKSLLATAFFFFIFAGLITLTIFLLQQPQGRQLKTEAASEISFPTDHGKHNAYMNEWWYINILTLSTKPDGTEPMNFSNLISFSRINNVPGLLTSFGNLSADAFTQRTDSNGTLSSYVSNGRWGISYSRETVALKLDEISPAPNGARRYTLKGTTTVGGRFDLTLTERTAPTGGTQPLLWGCTGKISVFAPSDTYYYSIPDLDVTGTFVNPSGATRAVKAGKAWIDHQWFNSRPPADWKGHYWTNSHWSTDGNVLNPTSKHQAFGVVTQLYNSGTRYTYWVRRNANGTNSCGSNATVKILNYASNGYPNQWQITLQNATNSTIATWNTYASSTKHVYLPPIGPSFFEPPATMRGTIGGTIMYGAGFIETHLKQSTINQ